MSLINRRTFLKLAGLFTVTSIAAIKGIDLSTKTVEQYLSEVLQKTNGIIANETFILSKPLNFYDCEGIVIRNCYFKPSKDFEGNKLIVLDKTNELLIQNCIFDLSPLNGIKDDICAIHEAGNSTYTSVEGCTIHCGVNLV
jgi:hypothetical protein